MNPRARQLEGLIREVRACFHRLKNTADALHADLEITASMRAVMESLAEGGPQSVPQVARAKDVSRQHIQVIVDGLAKQGLVDTNANPAHKRSPLVTLSDSGDKAFAAMRAREKTAIEDLAAGFSEQEIEAAALLLRRLRDRLQDG